MMSLRNIFVFFFIIPLELYFAQNSLLNGPLVGYSKMREVSVWVQTIKPGTVYVEYWVEQDTSSKFVSETIHTSSENANTGKIIITGLQPGNRYYFDIFVDNKKVDLSFQPKFRTQTLWQWRADPPNFRFAVGSCAYINEPEFDRPGEPYGGNYEIFESIADKNPEFMLWMGDNVYLREVDWDSRSGILHRYTHDRQIKELKRLFGTTHNYAIWDDHDFGPNNSDRGFINKDLTLEAFKLFWPNPSFGVNGQDGITTYFEWNDCAFFLLDDRYYRTPDRRKTGKREMLGENQLEWLIDALTSSRATFKFIVIGGQVLNSYPSGENFASFAEERDKLLNYISEEDIPGVIFLSGDIHRTELLKMEREGKYPLYEFTVSPLTSGVSNWKEKDTTHIVPGTLTYAKNFGVFEVSGERKNRILTFSDFDSNGKLLWKYTIKENELK